MYHSIRAHVCTCHIAATERQVSRVLVSEAIKQKSLQKARKSPNDEGEMRNYFLLMKTRGTHDSSSALSSADTSQCVPSGSWRLRRCFVEPRRIFFNPGSSTADIGLRCPTMKPRTSRVCPAYSLSRKVVFNSTLAVGGFPCLLKRLLPDYLCPRRVLLAVCCPYAPLSWWHSLRRQPPYTQEPCTKPSRCERRPRPAKKTPKLRKCFAYATSIRYEGTLD